MMNNRRFVERRGVILFVTLLLISVVIMMLGVVVVNGAAGSSFSQNHQARTTARYAAEEGLVHLRLVLAQDIAYSRDIIDRETSFGTSTYSIRFDEENSVNNLVGEASALTRRGNLPPGKAYIVVEGRSAGVTSKIEVLLEVGEETDSQDAVVAAGKVALRGNTFIDAVSKFNKVGSVGANVISFLDEDEADLVHWDGDDDDQVEITGSVRTASESRESIGIPEEFIHGSKRYGMTATTATAEGIDHTVASNSNKPQININSGVPTPAGAFYRSGDVTIDGDLVLEETTLYIEGKLTVNGAIRGEGTLYVADDTTFRGDTHFRAAAGQSVSLHSHGNVTLTGFNGSEYMSNITRGTPDQALWETFESASEMITTEMQAPGLLPRNGKVDYLADYLGPSPQPWVGSWYGARSTSYDLDAEATALPIEHSGTISKLRQVVEAQPDSETKTFLIEKFNEVDSYLSWGGSDPESMAYGTNLAGGFDMATDYRPGATFGGGTYDPVVKEKLSEKAKVMWKFLSKPGAASFQGEIVTEGYFYSANEVTVMGRISVLGDPETGESGVPDVDGAPRLKAGDLFLDNNSEVIHVGDLNVSGSNLEVRAWLAH